MSLFEPIPSPVEACDSDALEWSRLLELIGEFVESRPAREWLLALKPSLDMAWITREHDLVGEIRLLLTEGAIPSLAMLFDPDPLIRRARIEGEALEPEEVRDLLALIDALAVWQALVDQPPPAAALKIKELKALCGRSPKEQLRSLTRSLRSRLDSDGSLREDASPELRRIRREIDHQRKAIEDSLQMVLRRLSQGGSAQQDLITIRGERFVIPVKAEYKKRIPGVIHGASSSGQTVYLEPLETIAQNNDLGRLIEEEQREIHRIFQAMTREIGMQGEAILEGAAILGHLDTFQARARFAIQFDCIPPRFADPNAPVLDLKRARHPLLEKRLRGIGAHPVPLTLALNHGQRQLILSGPNAGGKSVALKSTGLLAMMAQAGIPVPAMEATFPRFHAFLADIGDAQSIEQNLSTFSAHILNVDRILRLADPSSLVLLDELGSSTDAEEGGALAVAVAARLLEANAWCLITTHHTSLKLYAANRSGVLNAAAGFDERTLTPTYTLRLGLPGVSSGLTVAQHLGLDPRVIEEARRHLNPQTLDLALLIGQLHEQLDTIQRERQLLTAREQEIAREKSRLESEGMKEWRAKTRDLERQLESLLKDFAYQMREAVGAISDKTAQQKLSKEGERRIARLRREFSEQFNSTVVAQHSGADKGDSKAQPHLVQQISAGDTILLKSLGKAGVVQRQIETNLFEVGVGAMKMRVQRDDIARVVSSAAPPGKTPIEAARGRGISVSLSRPETTVPTEVNVIGRTVDEASDEVDQFLDRAFLAGLSRVRIVHGSGMGVLRRSLRTMLEQHPHVAQVLEASQSEGGSGATVVELNL